MGKKKQHALGRTLIKDRFGARSNPHGDSFLHTSELNDGFEWDRLKAAQSVTEESSLEEFLATAQLAGTEFTAERLNAEIVVPDKSGLLSSEDQLSVHKAQKENRALLRIPRRPTWDETTTPEELDRNERDSFLEWRRKLAELQEKEHILLTPFERNLDFWRQLWRVIEKSDVVVTIVDSRNPLLFRSEDLETYVKEVGEDKEVMLLLNKADYLTDRQREIWAAYFDLLKVRVAFWSAAKEKERIELAKKEAEAESVAEEDEDKDVDEGISESDDEDEDESPDEYNDDIADAADDNAISTDTCDANRTGDDALQQILIREERDDNSDHRTGESNKGESANTAETLSHELNELNIDSCRDCGSVQQRDNSCSGGETSHATSISQESTHCDTEKDLSSWKPNSSSVLDGEELIKLFRMIHTKTKVQEGLTTVGLVGYPNVGKSSTINALLQTKKVPVSATPGRTKHFQTLYLDSDLMLCDCPGLVMPSFVSTKAEMVLNGILPIDQMRDYIPPTSLLARHIPRPLLEATYGIMLPRPKEGEDPSRPPSAHELLGAYGSMRGFMTHKGIPDFQRSSRFVLKDYVNGKLLYRNPPPDISDEEFEPTPEPPKEVKVREHALLQKAPKGSKPVVHMKSSIDDQFFTPVESLAGSKGVKGVQGFTRTAGYTEHHSTASSGATPHSSMQSVSGKPWKKHGNKNKKEKLRRLHSSLDT